MDLCSLDDVISALAFISPNMARDEWARVGMAIKSEFPDAFDVFDDWSQGGESYNRTSCEATWKSIKSGGGIGIGTLFALAKAGGWQPERRELSGAERARLEAERAEARRIQKEAAAQEEVERQAWHRAIAEASRQAWALLSESGSSEYLRAKGVKAWGAVRFAERGLVIAVGDTPQEVRVITGRDAITAFFAEDYKGSFRYLKRGALVVGVFDERGQLVNLQVIMPGGKKLFLKHGRKSGCCSVLGDPLADSPDPLVFAEGYATAASVHEATGWPVVITFDCSGLRPVVQRFRDLLPGRQFLIAADDDAQTDGNPGIAAAQAAALACGAVVAIPQFAGVVNGR